MQARKSNRLAAGLVLLTLGTVAAQGAPSSPAPVTSVSHPAASTGSMANTLPGSSGPATAGSSGPATAGSSGPFKAKAMHPAADNALANQAQARTAAKVALSPPKISQLRPTGPITVTANHAELVGGSEAIYVGNVIVRSNTMTMDGSRMEWLQKKGGQFRAHLTGHPAHLNHTATGPEDPSISARANTVIYDSAAQMLTLDGDAQLTRGENVVTGNTIRYDIAEKRVQATGGQNSQVKMIIEPPPPKTPPATPSLPVSGGAH